MHTVGPVATFSTVTSLSELRQTARSGEQRSTLGCSSRGTFRSSASARCRPEQVLSTAGGRQTPVDEHARDDPWTRHRCIAGEPNSAVRTDGDRRTHGLRGPGRRHGTHGAGGRRDPGLTPVPPWVSHGGGVPDGRHSATTPSEPPEPSAPDGTTVMRAADTRPRRRLWRKDGPRPGYTPNPASRHRSTTARTASKGWARMQLAPSSQRSGVLPGDDRQVPRDRVTGRPTSRALRDDPDGLRPRPAGARAPSSAGRRCWCARPTAAAAISGAGLLDLTLVAHEFGRHAAPGPLRARPTWWPPRWPVGPAGARRAILPGCSPATSSPRGAWPSRRPNDRLGEVRARGPRRGRRGTC